MNIRIGAHVSIAGGLPLAVQRAKDIGCNAVQIFSGSPRVWQRGTLTPADRDLFLQQQHALDVTPVVTHALYLLNLVSENPELVQKSVTVLKHDLNFDSQIKGIGVVVHLGSHQGRGWLAVREVLAEKISDILADTPEDSTFLIENSAGQQGKLCSEMSEIKWLMDQVKSPRLGWCFDTCHGFAAGYSLGPTSLSLTQPTAIEAITENDLWSSLKCIHINGSRDPFGSGRDRHANLGEGEIAEADFRWFVNQPLVKSLPLMLEVPGFAKQGPDKENVDILKSWLE